MKIKKILGAIMLICPLVVGLVCKYGWRTTVAVLIVITMISAWMILAIRLLDS